MDLFTSEIICKEGNLLDVSEGLIVHGCNAQGVMGAGVALAIRKKWPAVFETYRGVYSLQGNKLYLGQVIPVKVAPRLWVLNAITQQETGTHKVQVDYQAVHEVFQGVCSMAQETNLPVHFPRIGCGLAGGDWNIVSKIIKETCCDFEVPCTLWDLPAQS